MTTVSEDWRVTCPHCGRRISLTFGRARVSPHNTGKGGPSCPGSRMPADQLTTPDDTRTEEP